MLRVLSMSSAFCFCKALAWVDLFDSSLQRNMNSDAQTDCLVSDLMSSSAACDLFQSLQPDIEGHDEVGSLTREEQIDYMRKLTTDVVLMRTTQLFEECQQKTSTSSDTTLAMRGLDEQEAVYLQVHRYLLPWSLMYTALDLL